MTTRTVRRAPSEDYVMASASAQQTKQSNATQITVTPLTMSSNASTSSQLTVQPSCPEAVQTTTQYEHVTVVTQLGQQALRTTGRPDANSGPGNVSYTINATAGTSGLQVHPPSTLTQQVQVSVPTLASAPLPKTGAGRGGNARSQNFRNNGARNLKTPLSTVLPIMGRGSAKQLVNMNVIGDDGPTVRQHLQQQQQKARLQQQLALQARQKAEEVAKQNLVDSNTQHLAYSQPSSSGEQTVSSEVMTMKTPVRTTHVQRPYTPRVSTVQRQRAAAEAVKRGFKGASSSGLGESLPPLSLGPTRPPKMSRLASQGTNCEPHNGGGIVTVLQQPPPQPPQSTPTLQTVRQVQYRPNTQGGPQLVRSNSQPAGNQPIEQVYQVVTNDVQQFPVQSVVKIETTSVPSDCQPTSSSSLLLSSSSSQPVKMQPRKRPQRSQPQVRVTFLEPSKSIDFTSAPVVTSIDANNSSNYAPQLQTSQPIYGTPRQVVSSRELSQSEQFFPSPPSAAGSIAASDSPEILEQAIVQGQQVPQHNNLLQKQLPPQVQIVTQQQFSQPVSQHQLQMVGQPQMQQVISQHQMPSGPPRQQLQEVVVSSQQMQPVVNQQQMQQIANQSQVQSAPNQQQVRPTYQQPQPHQPQQRLIQMPQQMHQQRFRQQPLVQQQPQQSPLQQQLQTQPQQQQPLQQLQVVQPPPQQRPQQQFRQQPQPVQNSYPPRIQHPRVQQTAVTPGVSPAMNETREVMVVRHQNSFPPNHYAQARPMQPGTLNRPPAPPVSASAPRACAAVPQQMGLQNLDYGRKLYFLKASIKSLTYKNAALCDEIARLNQRVQTVTDQRRMLAKRLQHHERNRIRRIQTKLKKQAALAAKIKAFQEAPLSVNVGPEPEGVPHDADSNEFNDIDSERTHSPTSPSSSVSTSRLGTPDPQPSGSGMRPGSMGCLRPNKPKPKVSRHRKADSSLPVRAVGRKPKKSSPG